MRVKVRSFDTRGDFEARGRGEVGCGWNERVRCGAAILVDEEATDSAGLCTRRGAGRGEMSLKRAARGRAHHRRGCRRPETQP